MNASTLLPEHASDPSRWDSAMYAFLAEKERRSGSRRTVEGYSRMLRDFFGSAGKPCGGWKVSEMKLGAGWWRRFTLRKGVNDRA